MSGEVSLPVVVEEEMVGHLVVAWLRGRPDGDLDMEALSRLAALAALAIRHRRLATALTGGRDPATLRAEDLVRVAGQLRRIVDAAKDGIVTTDGGGLIASANPAAEALFGYAAGALASRPVAVILPGLALGGTAAARTATGTEVEGVREDGSRFPAELSVSTVVSDAGRAYVVIVRDVTERKAVERMKDEFVAMVSHELRTPLTALRGHVELVLDGDGGPVTEMQQRFLQVATQSADRLGALINDLLDVAKIEAGRVQLRKELVDLGGVLQEVAATFRIEATRHHLAFREELGELPTVVGDRDRLIQVFGNLVSNAIKYTRAGEVGVSARPIYGAVEVVVHDTGIGMTPDEQRQLFTKFFRSRDRSGPDPGGTGLGLVIVKGIVEGHGGSLAVESEPGAGTRVRVTLPAVGGPPGAGAEQRKETATVLVVDDEVALRDLLLEYLQMWDYGAVPAASGAEALELAQRIKPDLIILDVGMLPMSGVDVLRQLKKDSVTRRDPGTAPLGDRQPGADAGARCDRLPPEARHGRAAPGGDRPRPRQDAHPAVRAGRGRGASPADPDGPGGDRARGRPRPNAGRRGRHPPDAGADHRARPKALRRRRRPAGRAMERRPCVSGGGGPAGRVLAAHGRPGRRPRLSRRDHPRTAGVRCGRAPPRADRAAARRGARRGRWLEFCSRRTSSRSATW